MFNGSVKTDCVCTSTSVYRRWTKSPKHNSYIIVNQGIQSVVVSEGVSGADGPFQSGPGCIPTQTACGPDHLPTGSERSDLKCVSGAFTLVIGSLRTDDTGSGRIYTSSRPLVFAETQPNPPVPRCPKWWPLYTPPYDTSAGSGVYRNMLQMSVLPLTR